MSQRLISSLLCSLVLFYTPMTQANIKAYVFTDKGQNYSYNVTPTGENYTFKFAANPADTLTKLRAGRHVLVSVYQDNSIEQWHSASYIKERARCYVFNSHFYTYSLCFLPNDFTAENKNRFWGFVTRMPNWKWLATRFFLPVMLIFSLFIFREKLQKVFNS